MVTDRYYEHFELSADIATRDKDPSYSTKKFLTRLMKIPAISKLVIKLMKKLKRCLKFSTSAGINQEKDKLVKINFLYHQTQAGI